MELNIISSHCSRDVLSLASGCRDSQRFNIYGQTTNASIRATVRCPQTVTRQAALTISSSNHQQSVQPPKYIKTSNSKLNSTFFCCGVSKDLKYSYIPFPSIFPKKKMPIHQPLLNSQFRLGPVTVPWKSTPAKNIFAQQQNTWIGDGSCYFLAKKGQVKEVFQPINAFEVLKNGS